MQRWSFKNLLYNYFKKKGKLVLLIKSASEGHYNPISPLIILNTSKYVYCETTPLHKVF